MALLEGEPGSSDKTCATSILHGNEVIGIETEMFSSVTEEEDRGSTTIPVIKTEPTVSVVPVVRVTHISYRLYPELPAGI
jgi:hypothetical protein